MAELTIITADDAHKKAKLKKTLLVCAYDDAERFQKFNLEKAISLKDFESRLSTIPKGQEIIFYCA